MKRASGILLPVSSLPSRYGIGGFSEEAYRFVDLLARAGQSYWQILPLGQTGYGDSPYQSFSTFAGNPYFISLDELIKEGLLTEAECVKADAAGNHPASVDYEKLWRTRFEVLRIAYDRFRKDRMPSAAFTDFKEKEKDWLQDYCLYSAIKKEQGQKSWDKWPDALRNRDRDALEAFTASHAEEIDFYAFQQFIFSRQWSRLKEYAHEQGIQIIGDMPIYVAMDSADVWSDPSLFQFDAEGKPTGVAGCPPDAFSATGQLWGNPLYNWALQKKNGYAWWVRRMRQMTRLYDVIRIDHFRGFAGYWSIPYGDKTAERGHWEKGPGLDLFRTLEKALGKQNYIAEDLGYLTDDVREMVRDSGYPGMKVLEFAFDDNFENVYLPHHYTRNCVVYTGTHDNDTLIGWLHTAGRKTKRNLRLYVGHSVRKAEDVIRLAMESVADLCMIPMQDWLELDDSARMNFPSTLGGNWEWRLLPGQFDDATVKKIRELTEVYSRIPETNIAENEKKK